MSRPNRLYFIDRGERPITHAAPYHRYRICTDRKRAYHEAGQTLDGAHIWERNVRADRNGWLLIRWMGLDIDYGYLVSGGDLPGGGRMGFAHWGDRLPWNALSSAVWFSTHEIPRWLHEEGVRPPTDAFTLERLAEPLDWYRPPDPLRWAGPKSEAVQLALGVLANPQDMAAVGALKDRLREDGLFPLEATP